MYSESHIWHNLDKILLNPCLGSGCSPTYIMLWFFCLITHLHLMRLLLSSILYSSPPARLLHALFSWASRLFHASLMFFYLLDHSKLLSLKLCPMMWKLGYNWYPNSTQNFLSFCLLTHSQVQLQYEHSETRTFSIKLSLCNLGRAAFFGHN